MQRAPAGSRHLVWLVALGALLVLPGLAVWGPLHLRVLPEALAPAASSAAERPVPGPEVSRSVGVAITQSAPRNTEAAAPSRFDALESLGVGTTLLGIWALVGLALAGRLAYGAWSVRRIVCRARRLEEPDWQIPLYQIADRLGLEAAPRLLQSDQVKMPFAAGLLTSRIVLPAESEGWSAERRSAVLIHELGHVRRRDLIGHTLSRIVCAVYWFHPLVWTAARRLRAESERACDDLALVFGARPSDYAEHLLDIVTCVRDHNTPAVALAMAHRREFEGRMLAILNPDLRRKGPTRGETATLVGSLALLALLVGAAAPVPRAPRVALGGVTEAPRQAQPSTPDTLRLHQVLRDAVRVHSLVLDTAHRSGAPAPSVGAPAASEPPAAGFPAAEPGDDRAVVLARMLRTDSSARVRRVAAWGLNRYSHVDVALQALIAAVGGDANASVREMAAWALAGARRSSAASAALATAVRKDQDPTVRATAVWAAGVIGDGSAVDALVSVLGDADPSVRETAAWSIGNCHPDKAPVALVRALGDTATDVRLSAAWALYVIRDPETSDALDAAFHHETDGEVQRGLIRALGAMGDRSVEALQRLVSSPDSEIRTIAVTALAGGDATGPWPWPRPEPRPFP
jgi:beta-lactamase regulating signal transducer with metallopeptidase domain/HEAT repeat protein